MDWAERELTGWGRVHKAPCRAARPERCRDLARLLNQPEATPLLAFGNGRSYGDAALNSRGYSVLMGRLDRLLDFDPATGILVCEAGITFADLLSAMLPTGWVPPVMPGTGLATLGGGVANDIHGKNHHQLGSIGHHVRWLDLRLPNGEVRRLDSASGGPLWCATLGGIGLTGIIERIGLQLKAVPSNALVVRKRRIHDLDEFLGAFEAEKERAPYVVGWIDALARGSALGRGVLETAEPAAQGLPPMPRHRRRVPCDLPGFTLNGLSVRAFNALYFRHVPTAGSERLMHYADFLFPLDSLLDWNRIYGRKGFHQFQCVVPYAGGATAVRKMLDRIAQTGHASFLAVLKAMGPSGSGYLSFPLPGYTLALDFPNAPGAAQLIGHLVRDTRDAGGRVYLAKDSLLGPDDFRAMYPGVEALARVLAEVDPHTRMDSDMARRLQIRPASA